MKMAVEIGRATGYFCHFSLTVELFNELKA